MSDIKEENKFMQALNNMKAALSEIEKEYTMQQGTGLGEQDGNIGQAVDGEQGYSKDFDNLVKKKSVIKKMME